MKIEQTSVSKHSLRLGAALLTTGIAFGAFGAHSLRGVLSDTALDAYKTAVLYQLLHGVAFLALASLGSWVTPWCQRLLGVGTVLFSGSIYMLTVGAEWLPSAKSVAGPLTPIGGLLMILGWSLLLINTWRSKSVQ